MDASVSGVRQACICHQSVNAAIQKSAKEMAPMSKDMSNVPPNDRGDRRGGPPRPPRCSPLEPPCAGRRNRRTDPPHAQLPCQR
ncbi:hypothetical protein SSP531S_17660 [Streptomyces spongiicola]|uniref:Uncharacterized protein n=1 Tax=Streptomyces spongiicola TaxID=1690221 RepID=A0A388SWY0_9ACTN|nr:hypothetical protein SSP531S_17660 [Streptomyces spongiicola]